MESNDQINVDEVVAGAEKWDAMYLGATIHSVGLYEDPTKVRETVLGFLSRKNRRAFKLTNPFSKQIWLRELIIAFLDADRCQKGLGSVAQALKKGRAACALVTFTDRAWACPDTKIEFDLDRAKQKVRNALNGASFLAAFEAAYYINERWKKDGHEGKLVSFHCHAVVWVRAPIDSEHPYRLIPSSRSE